MIHKFWIFFQLREQLLLLLQDKRTFECLHHQPSRLRTNRVASACTGIPQHWVFGLHRTKPDQLHSTYHSQYNMTLINTHTHKCTSLGARIFYYHNTLIAVIFYCESYIVIVTNIQLFTRHFYFITLPTSRDENGQMDV